MQFVLCGSCKNPETFFVINAKAGDAWRDCKACGARTPLDLRHKLTSFIIKNPPPPEKKVKGLKSGAENSTAANAEAIMGISRPSMMDEAPPASSGAPAAGGDADEGQDAEVNEDEIPDVDGRSDDDDWAEDMSPEAVAARERELAGQLKNSMILGDQEGGDDDDEDEDSPYYQLKVWIQQERGKADQKAVLAKVKELGIEKKHKAVLVLSEWLFTENAVKEIPQFSKLFTAVRLPASSCRSLMRAFVADTPLILPPSRAPAARLVREAPEGAARRRRAPDGRALPGADRRRAQASDGLLPGRHPRRGGRHQLGHARQQEVHGQGHEQEGPQGRRLVPQGASPVPLLGRLPLGCLRVRLG